MVLAVIGSEMSTAHKFSACLTPSRISILIFTSSWPEVSRSQWPRGLGLGLRPLACWDCVLESRRGHGCLSLVNIVCCQMFLLWADPPSRGVVPSVMCPSVIAEPQQWRCVGLLWLCSRKYGANEDLVTEFVYQLFSTVTENQECLASWELQLSKTLFSVCFESWTQASFLLVADVCYSRDIPWGIGLLECSSLWITARLFFNFV